MIYFIYNARDEWGASKIKVEQSHEADLYLRITETLDCASIVIPRDRVPELMAALQRFMEETK